MKPTQIAVPMPEPPQLSGDVHLDGDRNKSLLYSSDFAPFKPRADILVSGKCYAPGRTATERCQVRLQVGNLEKKLSVTGNRSLKDLGATVSRIRKFTEMPLSYEFSYGGPKFRNNPLGKGHTEKQITDSGNFRLPLPNIEYPRGTPNVRDDEPAGFAPIDSSWLQRMQHCGSFGTAWQNTRWPWFPDDFNWSWFNSAPRDQQVDGYLVGDEYIAIENMHREVALWETRLPGLRARCFVTVAELNGDKSFREVPLVLDTLSIDMESAQIVLVWRGATEIRTIKMREIREVLALLEPQEESGRDLEWYRNELEKKVRARIPAATPADSAADAEFEQQFRQMEQELAAMEKELLETRNEVESHLAATMAIYQDQRRLAIAGGAEPHLLPIAATSAAPADLASVFDRAEQEVGRMQAAHHVGKNANNPPLDFDSVRRGFRDAKSQFQQMDGSISEMEKSMAGMAVVTWTRAQFVEAMSWRKEFVNEDFAGIDLSGLDLGGFDFSGSRLQNAKLSKANLTGARCVGTSFQKADLSGAVLDNAVLDGAILIQASCRDACMAGVSLNQATLSNIEFGPVNLSGCQGQYTDFSMSGMAGAVLDRAQLENASFTGCDLQEARFRDAKITDSDFEGAKAQRIDMNGACATGLRGEGADFSGSRFADAQLDRANFDQSKLDGSTFRKASLVKATFSDASVSNCNFERALLQNARFDDANLTDSVLAEANLLRCSFERANLTSANLSGANLFESGFWDAVVERTGFRNANLKGTSLG